MKYLEEAETIVLLDPAICAMSEREQIRLVTKIQAALIVADANGRARALAELGRTEAPVTKEDQ